MFEILPQLEKLNFCLSTTHNAFVYIMTKKQQHTIVNRKEKKKEKKEKKRKFLLNNCNK